jgi:hypothetical protein
MTETEISLCVVGFLRRDEIPPDEAGIVRNTSFRSGATVLTLGEPEDSTREPLHVELLEGLEVPLSAPHPDLVQIINRINNPKEPPVQPRRQFVRTMATVLFSALPRL